MQQDGVENQVPQPNAFTDHAIVLVPVDTGSKSTRPSHLRIFARCP